MTLIGYFENAAAAFAAEAELTRRGFDPGALHVAINDAPEAAAGVPAVDPTSLQQPSGFRRFFSEFFGAADEADIGRYDDAVRQGGALLAVDVGTVNTVDAVREALLDAGAVDIDERLGQWRADAPEPLAGGAGDTRSFADDEPDYRSDFETRYGTSGGSFDDYAPAYRFGRDLSADPRYEGRDWSAIEADAERDWGARYPDSAWDRFKLAIRHGWAKVTGERW